MNGVDFHIIPVLLLLHFAAQKKSIQIFLSRGEKNVQSDRGCYNMSSGVCNFLLQLFSTRFLCSAWKFRNCTALLATFEKSKGTKRYQALSGAGFF